MSVSSLHVCAAEHGQNIVAESELNTTLLGIQVPLPARDHSTFNHAPLHIKLRTRTSGGIPYAFGAGSVSVVFTLHLWFFSRIEVPEFALILTYLANIEQPVGARVGVCGCNTAYCTCCVVQFEIFNRKGALLRCRTHTGTHTHTHTHTQREREREREKERERERDRERPNFECMTTC